jgi:hypothetical protein
LKPTAPDIFGDKNPENPSILKILIQENDLGPKTWDLGCLLLKPTAPDIFG